MKMLLVQFRRTKERTDNEKRYFTNLFAKFNLDVDIVTKSALDQNLDEYEFKSYDRVVFGGSELSFEGKNEPDTVRKLAQDTAEKLKPFITNLVASNTPSLAICFGHQVFGYVFGAKVAHHPAKGKAGSFEVQLTQLGRQDPIFTDVPDKFYANYMHQDIVCIKPEPAQLLATGERCNWASVKYGQNSYSTQFHPELTSESLKKLLEKYPHYWQNENQTLDQLIKDVSHSHLIVRNLITQF